MQHDENMDNEPKSNDIELLSYLDNQINELVKKMKRASDEMEVLIEKTEELKKVASDDEDSRRRPKVAIR